MSMFMPQLRMGFSRFNQLTAPVMPYGYGLRTFRWGDEDAWIGLLNTGNFDTWDRPRLDRTLSGASADADLPLDGIFFATQADQPVGTVCVFLHRKESQVFPEIGWVVVHPLHRGHGLALEMGKAALLFIRDLGYDYAYLLTDDFRIPAIKTYLRLGFEPEMVDSSHPQRWEELRKNGT